MVAAVSAVMRRALYSQGTERVFIVLVSISHAMMTTLRFSSDGKDTVHDGNTYESYPFEVILPDDRESEQPTGRIAIANLSVELMTLLRTIPDPPAVSISIVLDDDPDRVERGPWEMELVEVPHDINYISGVVRAPSLLDEPLPANVYNTIHYPGL